MRKNKYALITVDTEALPKRASCDHVKRLIWGEHENGTAGVRQMCSIGDEFGVKHVFFVDMCGAYSYIDEMCEVVRWLNEQCQDVQLHVHPEYLPRNFWQPYKLSFHPRYMNDYTDDKEEFVIEYFGNKITEITGKKILAFRAGSFRWNAGTIRALKKCDIMFSFNNSMSAMNNEQCIFSIPENLPFQWSNEIIEIPTTEKNIFAHFDGNWWERLQYPQTRFFRSRPWWSSFLPYSVNKKDTFIVSLVHSWSLLYWDDHGHGIYKGDQRIEGYRKFIKRLSKDYDIITTADLKELIEKEKIVPTHIEELGQAEISATKS